MKIYLQKQHVARLEEFDDQWHWKKSFLDLYDAKETDSRGRTVAEG